MRSGKPWSTIRRGGWARLTTKRASRCWAVSPCWFPRRGTKDTICVTIVIRAAPFYRLLFHSIPPDNHSALEYCMPEKFVTPPISANIGATDFQVSLSDGQHEWFADEPSTHGGADTGPTPHIWLQS